MSKYSALRAAMGGQESFNDKSKNGRILKWMSDDSGDDLATRKQKAKSIFDKLRGMGFTYIQKVEIKNATNTASRFISGEIVSNTVQDYDKVCVFIDPI